MEKFLAMRRSNHPIPPADDEKKTIPGGSAKSGIETNSTRWVSCKSWIPCAIGTTLKYGSRSALEDVKTKGSFMLQAADSNKRSYVSMCTVDELRALSCNGTRRRRGESAPDAGPWAVDRPDGGLQGNDGDDVEAEHVQNIRPCYKMSNIFSTISLLTFIDIKALVKSLVPIAKFIGKKHWYQ